MDVEIEPEQPERVVAAVAALLEVSEGRPDPWWQAGVEESLETYLSGRRLRSTHRDVHSVW